jgi:hypothetical protein
MKFGKVNETAWWKRFGVISRRCLVESSGHHERGEREKP